MGLVIQKTIEDTRGKTLILSMDDKKFGMSETKKGFARGGKYSSTGKIVFVVSGKAKYTEKNLETNLEQTKMINAPTQFWFHPILPIFW